MEDVAQRYVEKINSAATVARRFILKHGHEKIGECLKQDRTEKH